MKASAVSTITKSLPMALSVLVNYSLLATLGYINLFTEYNKKLFLNPFLYTELIKKNPSINIHCFNDLFEGLKSYSEKINKTDFLDKELIQKIKEEERRSVESSNIASIGFNEASQILEIAFLSGGVYQYYDVPKNIYNGIMAADSQGQYFAQQIKNNYRYSKRL